MSQSNTSFLIAKHGLNKGSELGLLESWMWNLSEEDMNMSYISLHKTKSDRAHKGGEIVGFRDATDKEVETHQSLLKSLGKDQMNDVDARKIIIFKVSTKWNKIWPAGARSHQMAYKANVYIDVN